MNPFEYGNSFHNKSFQKNWNPNPTQSQKLRGGAHQICSNRPILIGLSLPDIPSPRRVIASFLQHSHIFTLVDPPQHQPMISSTAFLCIESPIFRFLAEILKNSEYNLISNLSRQRDQNVRDYLKIIADAKKMTFLTCDWSYEQALCRDLKI